MTRKTLLAAALAAGALLGFVSAAQAVPAVVATPGVVYPSSANVVPPAQPVYTYPYPATTVLVQPAPPAPIAEVIPAPREGYAWAPGHYEWRNGQYVWIAGEWMLARPGFAWRAGHWEQAIDGSWQFVAGNWVRTDDYAYTARGGAFGDRDGDGIINRDDRYPRDPSRY